MNKIIRLAFAARQKADAEHLVREAYKVFCQAVINFEVASDNHDFVRAEMAEMAVRN